MKRILSLLCCIALLLPFAGCDNPLPVFTENTSTSADPSAFSDSGAIPNTAAQQPAPETVSALASGTESPDRDYDATPHFQITPESEELIIKYGEVIGPLFYSGELFGNWMGSPYFVEYYPHATHYLPVKATYNNNYAYLTIKIYGDIWIDPYSYTETFGDQAGPILVSPPEEGPLAFGEVELTIAELNGYLNPVMCIFTEYSNPGLDYLKKRTKELEPKLAASEKPDLSNYDPLMVEYVWKLLFAERFIQSPEDITLYDLENAKVPVNLDFAFHCAEGQTIDASIFRLMPNIRSFTTYHPLKDYSIFEDMNYLEQLWICNLNDQGAKTLKVGHTDVLKLDDADLQVLDLQNVNAEILKLHSYFAAIGKFRGCDQIKKLYISSTRTDMRIVNAQSFPNIDYLNLHFYSDTPRIRDFSNLISFQNAQIDICLSYQACNNETITTLIGVPLTFVALEYDNGIYPLEIDKSLATQLDAYCVHFHCPPYFTERNGDTQAIYN